MRIEIETEALFILRLHFSLAGDKSRAFETREVEREKKEREGREGDRKEREGGRKRGRVLEGREVDYNIYPYLFIFLQHTT
jgi:hypothetical protein